MDKIIKLIESHVWNSIDSDSGIGLHEGLSGKALLYSYLYNYYLDEDYKEKLLKIIEKINALVSSEPYNSSISSGYAGYGCVLSNLNSEVITIDNTYFASIDTVLKDSLHAHNDENDYDFLHGAMGIALYFIERYKVSNEQEIEDILVNFANSLLSKIDSQIESVFLVKIGPDVPLYHFGLAHGVSGHLNFLISLKLALKEKIPSIDKQLNKTLEFLERFKILDNNSTHKYPYTFNMNNKQSQEARLGWCQGDLCIANAIYSSGRYLNNKGIVKNSVDLIKNCIKIDIEKGLVKDFSICHGSSGIALQYFLMSKMNTSDYSKAIKYWFQNIKIQTSDFTKFDCFYDGKYMDESNILNGSAGLGLVLLSIEKGIDNSWTRFFNLSYT